ncbi:Aspartate-semialdehyde dehydrogenase 2 [Anaerobiospirillum thomasii]|uniref:Asd/ArgC dimerization domain-containing protein n=1 Tax=Anaerobiospirillum thomasii TaxID=179995 RepID=UPI000D84DCBB|nr:Asd/ArgC dimerization domain-containing protein [Anaerobiospirillum thomasii]SPT68064.1 Aspartate-semialdehyde dehydrogenase 2 [Anaerobiospirillum thomasii]
MALNLAVYGYDTDVGKLFLELLNDSNLEIRNFYPLSPLEGEFDAVALKGKNHMIESVNTFDFAKADVALFLCTQDESARLVPMARESGCIVVDNSRLYCHDRNVNIMVPGINDYVASESTEHRVLATPLASTVMLSRLLMPLHDEYGIDTAHISLLESVSEHGQLGTDTLAHETTLLLNGMAIDVDSFKAQLAFNIHYATDDIADDGSDAHENALRMQIERVLGRFEHDMDISCVQVPVFYGHSAMVYVELEESASVEQLREVLGNAPGLALIEDDFVTPVSHASEHKDILVTRVRRSRINRKGFNFMALMDNTRLGEAQVCVDILKNFDKA